MGQVFATPEITKSYNYDLWAESTKEMLMETGCFQKNTGMFLTDTQLKYDFMLQDVNSLLHSGEIPNLFGVEEKTLVVE